MHYTEPLYRGTLTARSLYLPATLFVFACNVADEGVTLVLMGAQNAQARAISMGIRIAQEF
jgi:hypothetical protein